MYSARRELREESLSLQTKSLQRYELSYSGYRHDDIRGMNGNKAHCIAPVSRQRVLCKQASTIQRTERRTANHRICDSKKLRDFFQRVSALEFSNVARYGRPSSPTVGGFLTLHDLKLAENGHALPRVCRRLTFDATFVGQGRQP